MHWIMLFIVSCCLFPVGDATAAHVGMACHHCHRQGGAASEPVVGCVGCHGGKEKVFSHAMTKRSGEKQFVERSYGRVDSRFWEKNCDSCHVTGCRDCHSDAGLAKPSVAACQRCHNGYFIGWDYSGRAPREDNMRYQRGIVVNGATFLKMLPDVHYLAGMTCGACHSMDSLAEGKKSSKVCRDCHMPALTVLEHQIPAHLQRLECYACHSAWGAQEYGTFFLRFRDRSVKKEFDLVSLNNVEYLRSAYLKKQEAPPLGLNGRGLVTPIRPQFISYYTDIMSARNNGPENVLLAAEWRAYFPHTIQRGSVTCEGCHDNPTRFLLEPESRRIYDLATDGLGLESFWSQKGQRVVNGSFMDAARYLRMAGKSTEYKRVYLQKWKKLLNHVEPSSPP